jgi:hypothetical protein
MAEGPLRHMPSLLSRLGVGEAEMDTFIYSEGTLLERSRNSLNFGLWSLQLIDRTASISAGQPSNIEYRSNFSGSQSIWSALAWDIAGELSDL